MRVQDLPGRERLAQADLLLLLARLLSPPPEDRSVFALPLEDRKRLLEAAGIPARAEESGQLGLALAEAERIDPEAWQAEYTRLFDGAGPCPVNETAYVRRDKGTLLPDIAGFYQAFGWEPDAPGEKLDHLAIELEFAALLLVMAAAAEAEGREEDHRTTESALHSFVDDHLGEWIPSFGIRLAESSRLPLYQLTARVILGIWKVLVERRGWTWAGTVDRGPAPGEDAPFTCGMEPEAG